MINKKQYISLSFFLTRIIFLGGGFSLLIATSKNNVLLTAFLGMLLGLFLLYLFYRKGSINKWCVLLFAIANLIMTTVANTALTGTYLLYNSPTLFIMLAFLLTLIYGVSKEFKVISRVGAIFFPVALLITLLSILSLFHLVKIDNLFPLFNSSTINFIKGVCAFAGASLVPNLLLINYKGDLTFKDVSLGYLLGSATILIIMFFILCIYGYEFASIVRFPEYLILKKITVSTYVSNVENIFILEWIADIVIGSFVCLKVIKDNTNKPCFIVFLILFVLGMNIFYNNKYENILFIKKYFSYFNFFLIFLGLFIGKGKQKTD